MPAIGQQAPDFELLNQEGQPQRLSDLRGRRVILFAYPKAATPGCTTQACGFRDNFPQIEAGAAVVLGISPDEPAALLKWKQEETCPTICSVTRSTRCWRPGAHGASAQCMAASTWASFARTG